MAYDPGVSYHGDEYLFKGGQDLGKGLGQALSNGLDYVKKNDELKAKAKSYDGVVKADPEVLNAVGMHKSEWDLLGAKDKLATMDTYTKVIGTRGQMAQQAADAQKLDYYKTQNALGNQQLENGKIDAADLERYKGAMGKLNDPSLIGPPQALPDQMMNAAQTAGVNPRMADTIAQTAQRIHMANKQGQPDPTGSYSEDPVTGMRTFTYGHVALPTGVNPDKASPRAKALTGDDGTPLGYAIPNGKGGGTQVRMPGDTSARDKKLSADTFLGLHKAETEINDDIEAWNRQAAAAKADKNRTPPDPAKLERLKRKQQHILGMYGDGDGNDKESAQENAKEAPSGGGLNMNDFNSWKRGGR
jgi:hypothetical protein